MLVYEERGKPGYPKKNLSEQGRELTTNSTHIWRRVRDSNPGHNGGRQILNHCAIPASYASGNCVAHFHFKSILDFVNCVDKVIDHRKKTLTFRALALSSSGRIGLDSLRRRAKNNAAAGYQGPVKRELFKCADLLSR